MKKALIVGAILLMAGCSSTIETTYYQLPAGNVAHISSSASGNPPMLWVEQVTVPDYLAGNGLVYQTSDVKYVIASNNLWASPLDQQLKQTLVANLGKALPGRLVASTTPAEQHDTLSVTVSGFQGRYDGKVIVSGESLLEHQGRFVKQGFDVTLPQTEDGYDAMVRALAQGWQQAAQQMANSVASLN
ncbi:membrane integrity-associated transporter subunit PqiC [Pantoea eucrina]|uniref:Membrane integrity-associated transporter subunit PqiC n=1 Tax=Pantoea eucrina TaxID=472693 RepID=A0ABU5LFY5_9GAMM|nr:membrane integrity-associated transporter subunit PqiC [Pantoea eucrina]MDZ7278854.1 membrane integrity-associated transporter subunit PqiC [Pantoea eucrina]